MECTSVQTVHTLNDQHCKSAINNYHTILKHKPHCSLFSPSHSSFEDCTSGTLALDNLGYSTDQRWLWYDQVGLAGLSLIFLVINYISQPSNHKETEITRVIIIFGLVQVDNNNYYHLNSVCINQMV